MLSHAFTQEFSFTASGDAAPALAIPNIEMSIAVFETDFEWPIGFQEGSTPVTVAGLSGLASPENLGGSADLGDGGYAAA